jgi:hypothetical protein
MTGAERDVDAAVAGILRRAAPGADLDVLAVEIRGAYTGRGWRPPLPRVDDPAAGDWRQPPPPAPPGEDYQNARAALQNAGEPT